jgi:uncharacterized protein YyaL (SSP411 family)
MPNRLARESSPYLQQHASNPVDWHPWGAEALALARSTERPILLSVGYSACHWCHVMAHECFEDGDTAALMNRHFVNIKVDREERPDIDQVYQTAHQLLTRRPGGWPLTMFLTPEGKPFFGGTYFPKRARYNLPGFDELLQRVANVWGTQREQVMAQGDALVRHLADTLPARTAGDDADAGNAAGALASTAEEAAAGLRDASMHSFDVVNGGFGGAPKFPQASTLDALLRQAVITGDNAARDAVLLTLRRMAEGGLYDHLGGGFCRYSTDAQWTIPHFEKMLYDNGPLLRLYAQAWQLSGDALYAQVCAGTAAWLMREMQMGEGGYCSSLDADSEGEEGRFYVWQRDEVAQHLGADEFAAFAAHYGLDAAPNFEGHAWHLHVKVPLADVASRLGRPPVECEALIASARAHLFAVREARVRPGRDDKVLTAWNALAIDGMAFGASRVGQTRRGARSTSFVPRCGATAACWPPTLARSSMAISMTTRSCSPRCSNSCKATCCEPQTCTSPANWPNSCSDNSRTRATVDSSLPATTMKRWCCVRSRATMARSLRAMAWPRCSCSAWATWSANPVTWRPRGARWHCLPARSCAYRRASQRSSPRWPTATRRQRWCCSPGRLPRPTHGAPNSPPATCPA